MNRLRGGKYILYVYCGIMTLLITFQAFSLAKSSSQSRPTLDYSQLLQELKQGEVEEIYLAANPEHLPASLLGTTASVKRNNGEKQVFNVIPNNDGIVKLIIDNVKGDIRIPIENDGYIWFQQFSNIFFAGIVSLAILLMTLHILMMISQHKSSKEIYAETYKKLYFHFAIIGIVYIIFFVTETLLVGWTVRALNPMPYARFIQEIKQGNIDNIGFLPNRSRALVRTKDGKKKIVNIPPDDRLKSILEKDFKGRYYTIQNNRLNEIILSERGNL